MPARSEMKSTIGYTRPQRSTQRMNQPLNDWKVSWRTPTVKSAEQKLKEKLLASGLRVNGMDIPLRNMKAEAELF